MSFGVASDIIEGSLHNVLKLLAHNRFLPEVALAVLHPFKVRGGYATSAAPNIRDHEHPPASKNFICSSRSRAVRAPRKNLALHTVGAPAHDLVAVPPS